MCSVWPGISAPVPPPSGKSLVPLDVQGSSPQVGQGCVGVCGEVASRSAPEVLFLASLLPTFCHLSLGGSAIGSAVGCRVTPGLRVLRQEADWPWMD